MGTNELILKKTQAGIETTRGTGVAATRKVYANPFNFTYAKALQTFTDTSGTYDARRRAAYGRPVIGFTGTDLATFEDLPWWLKFAIKGGVVGVSDGDTTTAAYTYDFVPSASTDDLASGTFEVNEPGNPYKITQGMLDQWTLKGDSTSDTNPGWEFDFTGMGRDFASTTYTGSIADRVTEVILARGTTFYVDDAGGDFGTTPVTGELLSWSIQGANALHFKAFAEDVDSYAAGKVGRQARTYDATLTVEFASDAEFANYRSDTPVLRLVRLSRDGSQIHGVQASPSLPATNKNLTVDLAGYWSTISWADNQGNITAQFGLAGFLDATVGHVIEAKVVNALATLA